MSPSAAPSADAPEDSITVHVDKALLIQVGSVFKSAYKPWGVRDVRLHLSSRWLRIEFDGGTVEFPCESQHAISAVLTGTAFNRVLGPYSRDKNPIGKVALTFRPALGEFATPQAGVKARFLRNGESVDAKA